MLTYIGLWLLAGLISVAVGYVLIGFWDAGTSPVISFGVDDDPSPIVVLSAGPLWTVLFVGAFLDALMGAGIDFANHLRRKK